MKKYLVINDAGDGSISYEEYDDADEAEAAFEAEPEDWAVPPYAVLEIDFDAKTVCMTHSCQ